MYSTRTNELATPPHLVQSLGKFDLDPCAPAKRPWPTAAKHYTISEDGLGQKWHGRVWMNPPYGDKTEFWLARLAEHGDGIAVTFARTETEMFFKYVWPRAHAILFMKGRIRFFDQAGKISKEIAGAPSVLIAYGRTNARILHASGIQGKFIRLKSY